MGSGVNGVRAVVHVVWFSANVLHLNQGLPNCQLSIDSLSTDFNCQLIHLSSKIILDSHDIVFVGSLGGVGVLPYFGDHAPAIEAD